MRVLHVVGSLRPEYGGPARSVPALAAALQAQGCETEVWAPDGSGAGDGNPRGFDLVHDHGIWMPHNWRLARAARRAGVPRVVSPRGMLEPWALHHKRWKKKLAWLLYQRRDLAAAAALHATSEAEAGHIRKLFPKTPVFLAPNGVDLPDIIPAKVPHPEGRRTVLFLGRIYPVKGLPMLVDAWAQVRPEGWRVEIAGPDEAGHRREVEQRIAAHNLESVFHFTGPVEGAEKRAAFARADVLALPSYSENFGMAAAEALAHGVPVLTTTGTPWQILEEKGCGWQVEPTAGALADGLRRVLSCDAADLCRRGRIGRDLVASCFSWESAARAVERVYRSVVAGKSDPHISAAP